MLPTRETLLCRYHYDALDRLVDCTPAGEASSRRFYLKERVATEIQGTVQRSIMQHEDQLLAQQQRQSGTLETRLLATDQQRSVLNVLDPTHLHPIAYSPYGHRPAENGLLSLLGFNGERPDPVTGWHLLGNGYRGFNPGLMRFTSPDSWSPFGVGEINAYAYCSGDPVNQDDPTGHTIFELLKFAPRPPPRPMNLRPHGARSIVAPQLPKTVSSPSSPRHGSALKMRRKSDVHDSRLAAKRNAYNPIINDTKNYDLIGYHGSTLEHTDSLIAGLNNKYMGSRNGTDSGRGFYLTQDYASAEGWARTSKRAHIDTPKVFGVYAKNFKTLKPGRDYTITTELNSLLKDHTQIIISEGAFPSVFIDNIRKKQKVIRLNSFEAPF